MTQKSSDTHRSVWSWCVCVWEREIQRLEEPRPETGRHHPTANQQPMITQISTSD